MPERAAGRCRGSRGWDGIAGLEVEEDGRRQGEGGPRGDRLTRPRAFVGAREGKWLAGRPVLGQPRSETGEADAVRAKVVHVVHVCVVLERADAPIGTALGPPASPVERVCRVGEGGDGRLVAAGPSSQGGIDFGEGPEAATRLHGVLLWSASCCWW